MKGLRAGLLASLLAMAGCGRDSAGPAGEESCEELGDKATASAPDQTVPVYKVVSPNGGESFKVGDSLKVRLAANSSGSSAQAFLLITKDGVTRRVRLPGTPGNRSFSPREEGLCRVGFLIPDSLEDFGKKYGLVSDSVMVRLEDYLQGNTYADNSDGVFRITR